MKKKLVVDAKVPLPARSLVAVVQSFLKIQRRVALDLVHAGMVCVNRRAATQPHLVLDVGDEVEVDYAPQPGKAVSKRHRPQTQFEVVFDDAHLIIVVKPADLLTVPTPKRESNTLIARVARWLDEQQPGTQPFCIQRLDRGVSGLLVFAKSLELAHRLRDQFQARKPDRRYAAIVAGQVSARTGTFRSYLTTDKQLNRYSVDDPDGGELAITHYKVKETWEDATLVDVRLETGRRNQIRVHFAEAGHPVLGDPRYRRQQAAHRWWPHKRLALHAESLGFVHPVTKEPLLFTSPWPQEFRDFRKQNAK